MKKMNLLLIIGLAALFTACALQGEKITNPEKAEPPATEVPFLSYEHGLTPTITETPAVTVTLPLTAVPPTETMQEPTSGLTPGPSATVAVTEPAATLPPTELPEPTDPLEAEYWLAKLAGETECLMTAEEIEALNDRHFNLSGTAMADLAKMTELSSDELRRMIESYSIPNRAYYRNHEVTQADKDAIKENRNLQALQGSITLRYGVLTENTDMKSFPAEGRLTSAVDGRFDYLQETALLINEPVVVLHDSADGNWCFVQARNYYGWIRESSVAYCSREEMLTVYKRALDVNEDDAARTEKTAVVLKNTSQSFGDRTVYLRMGTKLIAKSASLEAGGITLLIPERNSEKQLVFKEFTVPMQDESGDDLFSYGYLSYTKENVMRLAADLLNTPYAWGDEVSRTPDGMDCSSTVAAVFHCFGFVLPRNTGTQRAMDCESYDMSGMSLAERKSVLLELDFGSLVYTSGHVMLYLGECDGEYYCLHNTTTESRDDGGADEFYRCCITTMSLGKSGQTITERLIKAIKFS